MTTNKTTRYDAFMDDLRGKMKAAYEQSEDLKAEFTSAETYAAYRLNEPSVRNLVRRYKADCANADNLAAFNAAKAAGRVRSLGQ